jgi:signal transduction histidine kinase
LSLQYKITERLLMAALREADAADHARASLAESVKLLLAQNSEATENARLYQEAVLLREQAEFATLGKSRFLGDISHELRTPLNAIIAYVEVIAAGIHGPVTDEQIGDLDRIRNNHDHLVKLVDELLAFARAGTARLNQLVPVPARAAVTHALSLVEDALTRKGIRHHCEPEDAYVAALADPQHVTQVLVNLLANAVKFTDRGGRIATRCQVRGEHVRISVTDTGIGIEPGKFNSIFEPFVQLNPSDSDELGIGLGLAISRDLARSMQGDISVESTQGEGSCFTLILPKLQIAVPPPSPEIPGSA